MKKWRPVQSGKGMKKGLHLREDYSFYLNLDKLANKLSGKPEQKIVMSNEQGM